MQRQHLADKTAARLSALSGGLTDGKPLDGPSGLDLRLMIWRLVDAAVTGTLQIDDTHDMALIGNVVLHAHAEHVAVSHYYSIGPSTAYATAYGSATAWNSIVTAIRARHVETGKIGVSGNEYQALRKAAEYLHNWYGEQPRAKIARAYRAAIDQASAV